MIEQQILQICSWTLKRDSFDWLTDVYTFKLQPENNILLKLIHLKSCWQCWLNTSIYTMNNSNLHILTQHMFKSSFYRSWLTTKWFIFIYWYMTRTLFLRYIKTVSWRLWKWDNGIRGSARFSQTWSLLFT